MSGHSQYSSGGARDEGRTVMIGAVMAVVILGLVAIVVIRYLTPDERLLVLQRNSNLTQVEEGDLIEVTGTVRRFGFARGFDAQSPGDTGGENALEAMAIRPSLDDENPPSTDVVEIRNDGDREGDRVTVVGEVDEVFSKNFFALVRE